MSTFNELREKIKELAQESRALRQKKNRLVAKAREVSADETGAEENREYLRRMACNTQEYRRDVVGRSSRELLLAYGFLRGRAYAQIEGTTRQAPYLPRVEETAREFGGPCFDEALWKVWSEAARAHLKAQRDAVESSLARGDLAATVRA